MSVPGMIYEVYFTGDQDPRKCIIIGQDVEHVLYHFEMNAGYTSGAGISSVRTSVYRNTSELVATLDWNPNNHLGLGLCSVRNRQPFPMSSLILPGSVENGNRFEWRRQPDSRIYDLYYVTSSSQQRLIARFEGFAELQVSSIGPLHGGLHYNFAQPDLLLEALLALCVNRCLDIGIRWSPQQSH